MARWSDTPATASAAAPSSSRPQKTAISDRRLEVRDPAVEEHPPADVYRDHVGIHPQKQQGLSYVGAAVLRGRITAEQMHAAANLADRHYLKITVRFTPNVAGTEAPVMMDWRQAFSCPPGE